MPTGSLNPQGIESHRNPGNTFLAVRLHYTADPDKARPEWKAENEKRFPPEYWRREYEIDFTAGAGIPAFPDFGNEHVGRFPVIPERKVYRGWDWGFQHPAFVTGQFDDEGRFLVQMEHLGMKLQARTFAQTCKAISRQMYEFKDTEGAMTEPEYIDWCDWSVGHRSDKSPRTTLDIVRSEGIRPTFRKMERKPSFDRLSDLLKLRIKGLPALMIDESCQLLIRGFRGEYAIDEKTDLPGKDGYFEHPMDALRYMLDGACPPIHQPSRRNQPKRQRLILSKITGY